MRLTREFYETDVVTLAKNLLGKTIHIKIDDKVHQYRIVETESYCGLTDKASHAYLNKRTKRTEVMFDHGGILYVYLIYGMYYCLNIVANQKEIPQAVLIRAIEPLTPNANLKTNGPGKICRALKIDKTFNGLDLVSSDIMYITDDGLIREEIVVTTRINIDYAEEARDFPWRFYLKDNPYVSKK